MSWRIRALSTWFITYVNVRVTSYSWDSYVYDVDFRAADINLRKSAINNIPMSVFSSTVSCCNVFRIRLDQTTFDRSWVSSDRLLATFFLSHDDDTYIRTELSKLSPCVAFVSSFSLEKHDMSKFLSYPTNNGKTILCVRLTLTDLNHYESTKIHHSILYLCRLRQLTLCQQYRIELDPCGHLKSSKISNSQVRSASMCFTNRFLLYPTIWKCASLWPHPKCSAGMTSHRDEHSPAGKNS